MVANVILMLSNYFSIKITRACNARIINNAQRVARCYNRPEIYPPRNERANRERRSAASYANPLAHAGEGEIVSLLTVENIYISVGNLIRETQRARTPETH